VNRRVIESLIRAGAFDFQKATRASLVEALPAALERGQRSQRDRALGQASLFGGTGPEPEPQLAELAEWDRNELLTGEKEVLGFYVTGHPLQEHRDLLERFSQSRVAALGDQHRGRSVRLGGLVTGVSPQRTRRGDLMARGRLEDLDGTLGVVFFPKVYDRCAPLLRTSEPIFLTGVLQPDSERLELHVEEVIPLAEVWNRCTRELRVRLEAGSASPERLRELRAILDLAPGPVPVALSLILPGGAEADLELTRHRVSVSEDLIHRVDRLFGTGVTECHAAG
jgi:DNA polymerase-3 subunit alpha